MLFVFPCVVCSLLRSATEVVLRFPQGILQLAVDAFKVLLQSFPMPVGYEMVLETHESLREHILGEGEIAASHKRVAEGVEICVGLPVPLKCTGIDEVVGFEVRPGVMNSALQHQSEL